MTITTTNTNDAKRIPAIEATISHENLSLLLKFSNGSEVFIDAGALSEEMRNAAMMHGLKQKLVDAAAISRDTETGRSATIEDKYNAVREVAERLRAGEWNKKAEGGGGGPASLLARAVAELRGKPLDVVRPWLDAKTKEERAALKKNPRVASIILRMQAEAAANAKGGADSDSLLSELGV